MKLLSILEVTQPLISVFIFIALLWLFISVFIAIHKRKKKLFVIPGTILAVLFVVLFILQKYLNHQLNSLVSNSTTVITVNPKTSSHPKELFAYIINNRYSLKKKSGSSPTDIKYTFTLCDSYNVCIAIKAEQDSRDPNMYWLSSMLGSYGFIELPHKMLHGTP